MHTHNFINKYTAFGVLILVIGCFWAGYFVGKNDTLGASVMPITIGEY